jgi:Na+-translocating ferredoxin:NAD+ oxidoreductase RNF subunit RnfB
MERRKACAAPMNICMTFGGIADSLIRHGYARRVDAAEGMDLLAQAHDNRLVQFGENVQRDVAFICNCCGCCCEAMIAARRFGRLAPVHTTSYEPHVAADLCNGCGKCVDACPVEAMNWCPPMTRTNRASGGRRWTRPCASAAACARGSAPRTGCG